MSTTAVRTGASREAEPLAKNSAKRLRVNKPGDSFECEADRVADTVSSGGRVRGWSLSSSVAGQIQRDPTPSDQSVAPKPNNYGDALGKIAEAFLKTSTGKEILNYFTNQPIAKAAMDFVETPAGIAVTGSAAIGAISALAVTHKALPAQIPAIPLNFIQPGLKLKINYEGPVNHPTQAMLSISYEGVAPKKKGGQTEKERFRAETASMAADQAKFRAGLAPRTLGPVASPEARQQEAEDKMVERYELNRMSSFLQQGGMPAKPGQYTPLVPGTQPLSLHMRDDFSSGQSATPSVKMQEEQRDEIPVQRKAETGDSYDEEAAPDVEAVLSSAGHPLDRETRRTMESRVGFDFSKVRIHSDSQAAASAEALGARAYTVRNRVVFGQSRYAPHSAEGQHLLAHELTHVVQQASSSALRPVGIGPAPKQIQRDEKDSRDSNIADFAGQSHDPSKNMARKTAREN